MTDTKKPMPPVDFIYMADEVGECYVDHFKEWVSRERLDEKLRELISILAAAKEMIQMVNDYDFGIRNKYNLELLRPIIALCINDALQIAMACSPQGKKHK